MSPRQFTGAFGKEIIAAELKLKELVLISILALPVAALSRHFRWALMLTALVACECALLAANRGRCPMTDCAARFTEDRAANFDIYHPNWLARNNKAIFGTCLL